MCYTNTYRQQKSVGIDKSVLLVNDYETKDRYASFGAKISYTHHIVRCMSHNRNLSYQIRRLEYSDSKKNYANFFMSRRQKSF